MSESCRICGNDVGNRSFTAREMMLGTRDEFEYIECSRCGALQIGEIPDDLGRYYPDDYYSLQGSHALERISKGRWMRASLGGRTLLGSFFMRLFGPHPLATWKEQADISMDSAILDVGCGDGRLLRTMRRAGFRDLTGVDPFMAAEHQSEGLRLLRRSLDELDGSYDLIMMHHSLEHVRGPRATLEAAAGLLNPGGTLLIRTPVAGAHAWERYGADWVQIDAPRHLHVLSEKAVRLLAEKTGFAVAEVAYDSSAFQFWGSELYARDIAYRPKPSYRNRPSRALISRDQMKRFHERARELNASGDGDSAAFYLRRAGS